MYIKNLDINQADSVASNPLLESSVKIFILFSHKLQIF